MITDFLVEFFVKIISAGGYGGVVFLMTLESMVAPVPSEAVVPFAGFLWFSGKMAFWPIVTWSTMGSVIGSSISYYIGRYGGEAFVKRYGRYFFLNEGHLVKTEKFFGKFGHKTIFIGRFIPVVRHLISIPAGAGKMNFFEFVIYTFLGAGIWNAFLAWAGYELASNWIILRRYGEAADVVLGVSVIILIGYFFYKNRRRS